jgi:hypothetical protein
VDVLGGTRGVLYRRRFFNESIKNYHSVPPEAFFVDDDWISGTLDASHVERYVISSRNTKNHHDYPPDRISLPNSLSSVENNQHNMYCQEVLLTFFWEKGLFRKYALS